MKNLVMGVAKGYGWDILEPFVTSFVKNCPSAELVLFVDDISDFTRARLQGAGVLLKNFPEELRLGVPNNTRWKIFSDYLKIHGDSYAQIFITDTCDVIFQGDVFEPFKSLQNYLGLATEADVIGGNKAGNENHSWLADCFGAAADELIGQKIICDGTIIGTPAEMKLFAENMRDFLSVIEGRVNFRIHDQAVANYLVYKNFLTIENLIGIPVDGEIFTMGLTENFFLRGNKILSGGGLPAVVHQYNRHNELIEFVDALYHDKNFQPDARFNDIRSVTEQATCLLFANKIGDAARLFMKNFLVEKNFGGCVKALLQLWEIAMRYPLSPASEFLEISAQSALKSVEKFSASDWDKICTLLQRAQEARHPVDSAFKNYIVARLLRLAEEKFAAGEREQYLSCIELIISIEGGEIFWARK